jgi:hypothetical protein
MFHNYVSSLEDNGAETCYIIPLIFSSKLWLGLARIYSIPDIPAHLAPMISEPDTLW